MNDLQPPGCWPAGSRTDSSSRLVPLGLVFAAVLSFWVDEDPAALRGTAAQDFGISGAATQSAMNAIEAEHHARWYFLLAGIALVIWFGIGVV